MAQVPGGMLTNLESQLKQQNASDKLDQVLQEIPRVREDLGFIPLVTPTSQIVGTQAVINVLMGERYKTIAKETAGILKGEYGRTPAAVNTALQALVLEGAQPITDRPADHLAPEMDKLTAEVKQLAKEKGISLAENEIDDVLIVALFPQVGLKFLENRGNSEAFEPAPTADQAAEKTAEKPTALSTVKSGGAAVYTVELEGKAFVVKVSEGGDITNITPSVPPAQTASTPPPTPSSPAQSATGTPVTAPMSGNIWKVVATEGQTVAEGDILLVLEAMKMETEIRAVKGGIVQNIAIKAGDTVTVGDTLMTIA
ncbi:oxaloacetate decarboxylase subunit alpha [Rodentibacter pneumotropicus]|uniref:Oxaloacetate decarboxylase subunit alpha n=1 Tax=Rodentibacter pneumotropicus TaxID=758 RepID=A0A448MJM3_9PAST|nr:oxaloacetate decarboxylase subunit alpha [Rodentibacter pneumotropicus]